MKDTYIGITPEQFQEFTKVPETGPFQMFNLLKFKDKVSETGTSGVEAYAQYMQAASPFFQASNAKVIYHGKPVLAMIGPNEGLEWDKILIIEYASKEDFLKMITAEGYPGKLRSRALEDSRLILCTSK